MGTRSGFALPRAILTAGFVLAAVLLTADTVQAQIWIVVDADGAERFTSAPEPGARLFLRTRYSSRPNGERLSGIPYGDSIAAAAIEAGVEAALVTAVIAAESNFDPHAVSRKGARGLMQLMPATAADLGVEDVWDPHDNIMGGTKHLARLLTKYDDVSLALAAYNAGEGAVERHGGIPPFDETQEYVERVLGYYGSYKGSR